jgi:hypothetical protein
MGPLFSTLLVLTVAAAAVLAVGAIAFLVFVSSYPVRYAAYLASAMAVVMVLAAVVGTSITMVVQYVFLPKHLIGWQPILFLGCGLGGGIFAAAVAGRLVWRSACKTRLQTGNESGKH